MWISSRPELLRTGVFLGIPGDVYAASRGGSAGFYFWSPAISSRAHVSTGANSLAVLRFDDGRNRIA
jgi:hypothetical protein